MLDMARFRDLLWLIPEDVDLVDADDLWLLLLLQMLPALAETLDFSVGVVVSKEAGMLL